jgi:Na+-driven multidrug efflux pump
MTSQVLLNGRILGVLVGGAIGAGNSMLAGVYLQVSLVVLFLLSIVVVVAWSFTEQVWLWFGIDAEICRMAGFYAQALSTAIPGIVAFNQLSQFFSAQRIMHPEVNTSVFGLLANLLFGLILVLGWPITGFEGLGFKACPLVTASVTYLQLVFIFWIYVHIQQLHAPCWPGWKRNEITWARVKTFCDLYFPAAFSMASDFWRVAVIGGVAARLGESEVAVFNTAYRIMWIALIFVGALAGASAINMSIRLGNMDPFGARQVGYVGIALSLVMLLLLGVLIVVQSRRFGLIFTRDEEFLALFEEASIPFTVTLCFMNLSVAIERIPYSMG